MGGMRGMGGIRGIGGMGGIGGMAGMGGMGGIGGKKFFFIRQVQNTGHTGQIESKGFLG